MSAPFHRALPLLVAFHFASASLAAEKVEWTEAKHFEIEGKGWSDTAAAFDRPVINLGFSSAGTMEPPVAAPLAEIDPAAYVIDCIWNMNDDPNTYMKNVTQLVRTIRKTRPDVPILFVGQSLIHPDAHPTKATLGQEAAVHHLQSAGVKRLYLVSGKNLIGDDGEGTVDGVHPNDLGMDRQARALLPIVLEALKP